MRKWTSSIVLDMALAIRYVFLVSPCACASCVCMAAEREGEEASRQVVRPDLPSLLLSPSDLSSAARCRTTEAGLCPLGCLPVSLFPFVGSGW
jgi:hypothetical protein